MPTDLVELLETLDDEALLTTGEVAKLLGTSRQHIVDLCDRGDLPYRMVGSHRRIRFGDALQATQSRIRMQRDQRRSLWLAYAVAGEVVRDPEAALRSARSVLTKLEARRSNRWTQEWAELLDGSIDAILGALTSTSLRSRELRQNSPFTGILSEQERDRVLESFTRTRR